MPSKPRGHWHIALSTGLILLATLTRPSLPMVLASRSLRLGQHPSHNALFLNDKPQSLGQLPTPISELGTAKAEENPAKDLPRHAALRGECRAGQDCEFGNRIPCRLRVLAVVVEAQRGGEGKSGVGRENCAAQREADRRGRERYRVAGWVVGGG